MTTDPFSDILMFANAQSVVSGGLAAGGAWAVRFPAPQKLKFFCIVKGSCWLKFDDELAATHLDAGDVFLLSARRSFILAEDLANDTVEAKTVFAAGGPFARVGHGDDFSLICGHVQLDSAGGGLLVDVLPPLIHIHAASSQAAILQWLLDQLVHESVSRLPGASVVSAQLAQLIFVQLLRGYLADEEAFPVGWLRALSDTRIAPALRLMHGDPGRAWQLAELARSAAMSRTTFALRFKAVAGVPPLTYLLNWRMRLAERALREQNAPIFDLAMSLGYTSESAFSNAFKRVVGMAPKRYQIAQRSVATLQFDSRIDDLALG